MEEAVSLSGEQAKAAAVKAVGIRILTLDDHFQELTKVADITVLP